jgi:predicted HicB family RNase H-like nuclease
MVLKDWLDVVEGRITEGDNYCWSCYGDRDEMYSLTYWNQKHGGQEISSHVVYNRLTQQVFEADVIHGEIRAYRWIHPDYRQAAKKYAIDNGVESSYDYAYDDFKYIDLETEEDFIQKATSIVDESDYDTRIEMPLTLDKEELYRLMELAHKADMTLNQYVEHVLQIAIDKFNEDKQLCFTF